MRSGTTGRATPGDGVYPERFLDLVDPPPFVDLLGDPDLLKAPAMVAVVGSRRATLYGRRIAEQLSREWASMGVVVVSGLAMGIDAATHEGALAAGGGTVAVLGSGIRRPTPRSNAGLARRIEARGLLLSEFAPDADARPFHFPRRNRLIAALAGAVVVVEASRRSGALITVDHALDLGREVFAVPGPVDREQSVGTNALIRDGARPLLDAEELVAHMGWTLPEAAPGGSRDPSRESAVGGLSHSEARILAALTAAGGVVASATESLGIPPREVQRILTELELAGWVRRGPPGVYQMSRRRVAPSGASSPAKMVSPVAAGRRR